MTVFWLTPLLRCDPLTFGAGRIKIKPTVELDLFREELHQFHPRFLMLLKANILISDEETDACGVDDFTFSLEMDTDVVFDGEQLMLSHCAEAFLDRLPSVKEMKAWMPEAWADMASWTPTQKTWLQQIIAWLELNHQIILLKED